jgi:D-alanyl-D-alanine carboxypeptidase/D-alanyl-D-alanine-endopeptidase (penicillin-binding protein 4)
MYNKWVILLCLCCSVFTLEAQTPPALKQFLSHKQMQGASFSFMAKEIQSGEVVCAYETGRELTPASIMKLVTTAAALELLGEDYRFATSLEYDGQITDSVLQGNLYIRGSGDPTLGSSHFAPARNSFTPAQNTFIPQWIAALKKKGIRKISGSVIADERIFDTEGLSMKWTNEDMGSYYGAGSYGISVFDNLYKLYVNTGVAGSPAQLAACVPSIPSLRFHNYLKAAQVATDSTYITGSPFSNDRYLYGLVPANQKNYMLRGDIPDPPLFLAQYVSERLQAGGIAIAGSPACCRILAEENRLPQGERRLLAATYSPPLREIVRITNERSNNLYAEALLRTLGLLYPAQAGESLSSATKGIRVVQAHWSKKGLDTSSLWMYDGSGLAASDKLTASFLCELLIYMATRSEQSATFIASLPKAGLEGTVASFLKGTPLQGKALLKSGGMSRVRTFAGYISQGNKQYAFTLMTNNFSGDNRSLLSELEKLLQATFRELRIEN